MLTYNIFIIILCIIVIILSIKLYRKIQIDTKELNEYNSKLDIARANLSTINYNCEKQNKRVQELENKYYTLLDQYKKELNKKTTDLDLYFENQKLTRQSEMDTDFERLWREKEENLKSKYAQFERDELEREYKFRQETQEIIDSARESQENILAETRAQQERFEGLLLPLRQYEMEQQERLFYTIQVPDEYKDDINFLITTVSQKVQHPDIINKLVWAEYVKPYIDGTFKRVGIEDKPGIYKITNIDTGKCYIGKSTNVKKRITDHFKSSIGIKTIADQAVHHEIWKTGFWNWTIEVIIYCEKEQLNELEKYYIDFFKSQEFGYNKNVGGGG